MSTPTKRLSIVIDLEGLRGLMREFMSEVVTDDDNNIYAWPFETFLQWAKRKREAETSDSNLLTFRIEKEGARVPDDKRRI